jgi:tRNA(Ser,Leu) C12 N-acetylase TAN1
MADWNVIVTARERHFGEARRFLSMLGDVGRTHYFNVLRMYVDDGRALLDALGSAAPPPDTPPVAEMLGRAVPLDQTFHFQTKEELDAAAENALAALLPRLAGKSFHVRMHRRGFEGTVRSTDEEQTLDRYVLAELEKRGAPGRLSFDDPDVIVALETLDNWGGISAWSREDLRRYPLLGLD